MPSRRGALPGGLLRSVKPFIAAAAVIVTGTLLIAAIYFTLLDLQWIAFLAGILVASILAMTAQATRAGIKAEIHAQKLTLADYRLTAESGRRQQLEKLLAAANERLHYADVSLPAMLAFVDSDTRYRYHNRAFRDWLGMPESRIDGQHVRDVLGPKVFAEIEHYLHDAMAGRLVRYERTQKSADGALFRIAVQFLPQFGQDGKYAGLYVLITDITERRDVRPQQDAIEVVEAGPALDARKRILAAIQGNEFALFCQKIAPLQGKAAPHYEVFIRLREEESSLIPPGAFFPLAEEQGLLPQLDRWVFSHVLDWMAGPEGAATVRAGSIYFINISLATISDPDFPQFAAHHLRRTGVPAAAVSIEIDEADLTAQRGDAIAFARALRQCGCRTAISGFGRHRLPMDTLKLVPMDFIKIHGGIVRQILVHESHRAKVAAIGKLAISLGVRTVAELVEDDATLADLRELNIDYAQGFGVARPRQLAELALPDLQQAA